MSTNKHTAIALGAAANAAVLEAPLGQLDAAIVALETAVGGTALGIAVLTGSAASGQKVLPYTGAPGPFIVGQPIWIGDVGGTFEVGVIASIQAAVSLTVVTNLTNTYAAGKIISASPSELVDARGGYQTLNLRLAAQIGVGTAFPGSPAANDFFRRTDRSSALYHYTGAAWVQVSIPSVTAFWVTPTTNDRCYRTDRSLEYFYDGTRWLTTTLYTGVCPQVRTLCPIPTPQAAALNVANGMSWNSLYQEWLVDFQMASSVATLLNGTNYWTVRLVEPGTTLATLSTIADANINTWYTHRVAVGSVIVAHNAKSLTVQTTGSPGVLDFSAFYSYRLIG